MPENFLTGETTKLYVGDGAGTEVFTALAQVIDIDCPELSRETVKRSTLGAGVHRMRASKKINANTATFTVLWDPANAQHTALITDVNSANGAPRNWRIGFDNGEATNWPGFAFRGFVQSVKPNGAEEDQNMSLDVTIQLDGLITAATIATP